MKAHERLYGLSPLPGYQPAGMVLDCYGVVTRIEFYEGFPGVDPDLYREGKHAVAQLPGVDEEYFEILDLVDATRSAQGRFVMVELGAGFGRWLVRAAKLLERFNPMPLHLVAVEAEPTHFAWIADHFRDNGLDPDAHVLVQQAVSDHDGEVTFAVGNPGGWYGQAIVEQSYRGSRSVPCGRLAPLLAPYERVDLIDMDVQGEEARIVADAIGVLDDKVRFVHIGTHSAAVEESIARIFRERGWTAVWEFPCGRTVDTPFGPVTFGDGVYSYRNPRFVA